MRMGAADLEDRILDCLEEKPRSISEIARELDEEKYEISKRIEVLEDNEHINTYKIGRSTACILADDDTLEDDDSTVEPDTESSEESGDGLDEPVQKPEPVSERLDDGQMFEHDEQPVSGEGTGAERSQPADTEQTTAEQVAGRAEDVAGEVVQEQPQMSQNGQPGQQPQAGQQSGNMAHQSQIQQNQHTDGPRTIGVVSGKGGVGKTVVTLNLGAAMMDVGRQVIVLDADAEMPNVGLQLGMYSQPTSLRQVVEQDIHVMSAMQVDKDSGLRVIPTSLSREPVDTEAMEALNMIPDDYVVLIDSPPGYERPVERVIETCDELIFVTTPEIPSVTDTFKLYQEARKKGKNVLGVVINMYDSPKKHLSVAEVEGALEMPVLGVIDDSALVQKSIFDNQPVVSMRPHAKPSRAFKQIAADMTGERYEVSLFDRLRGMLP